MLQKTFYRVLREINENPAMAKKSLSDKRLTVAEKRILESYLLIRSNQNQQAFEVLTAITPTGLPFVDGQKELHLGICLNNLSRFSEAEEVIQKAIPVFQSLECHYFLFMCHFNLCLIYLNSSEPTKMLEMIDRMDEQKLETTLQTIRLLRCKFAYHAENGHSQDARIWLHQLGPLKPSMHESDRISQLLCEFRFFVREQDFNQCHSILNEMKAFRKFQLSENFNFMKKLLEHLTQDTPVYTYQEFEAVPLLKHQIGVIKALEESNLPEAQLHWSKLSIIAPELYLDHFQYRGNVCLFSLCLDKHISKPQKEQIKTISGKSTLDRLINLLLTSDVPLSKGYIYEYLWHDTPTDKNDLMKLVRIIYRAKKERGINIHSRKGNYFIDKSHKKTEVG